MADDSEANTQRSLIAWAQSLYERQFGAGDALEAEIKKLDARPFNIQKRKAELESKIKARSIYLKRFGNFQPLVGTEFQCPRCWMKDEVRAGLDVTNVRGGRYWRQAELHCWRCHQDFFV